MLQEPLFDGVLFNPFALLGHVLCYFKEGVGRADVILTLVIVLMVVVLDERFDLLLKVAGHIALTVVYSP